MREARAARRRARTVPGAATSPPSTRATGAVGPRAAAHGALPAAAFGFGLTRRQADG
jgi:hypothetical protein